MRPGRGSARVFFCPGVGPIGCPWAAPGASLCYHRVMPVLLRWLLRLGPTNPIAVRLVHGGSRRTRHMPIRSGYLAALIIVLLWLILAQAGSGELDYRVLAGVGASSFTFIAYLQ